MDALTCLRNMLIEDWPSEDQCEDLRRMKQITTLHFVLQSVLRELISGNTNTNPAIHQLTKLCADLQKDMITLQCQVLQLEQLVTLSRNDVGNLYQGMDSLIALREKLDAVFTVDTEPNGTGEVQS